MIIYSRKLLIAIVDSVNEMVELHCILVFILLTIANNNALIRAQGECVVDVAPSSSSSQVLYFKLTMHQS